MVKSKLTIREKIEGLILVAPMLALIVVAGARLADAAPTGVADTKAAVAAAAMRGCVARETNRVRSLNPMGGATRVRREQAAREFCASLLAKREAARLAKAESR